MNRKTDPKKLSRTQHRDTRENLRMNFRGMEDRTRRSNIHQFEI